MTNCISKDSHTIFSIPHSLDFSACPNASPSERQGLCHIPFECEQHLLLLISSFGPWWVDMWPTLVKREMMVVPRDTYDASILSASSLALTTFNLHASHHPMQKVRPLGKNKDLYIADSFRLWVSPVQGHYYFSNCKSGNTRP